jgi:thioredoxin-related protein
MDANVFPNIELSKMFDENFINYKIDMESQAGEIFEEKYSVEAFPTLFFISPNGTVLKKVVGAMSVEKLIDIGNLVLSPESSILITLEKQFAKGDISVDFLKSYVEELNKVNENNTEVSTALLLALGVDKIAEDEKMFVIFYQTQFSIES